MASLIEETKSLQNLANDIEKAIKIDDQIKKIT